MDIKQINEIKKATAALEQAVEAASTDELNVMRMRLGILDSERKELMAKIKSAEGGVQWAKANLELAIKGEALKASGNTIGDGNDPVFLHERKAG